LYQVISYRRYFQTIPRRPARLLTVQTPEIATSHYGQIEPGSGRTHREDEERPAPLS
jgi:hypothetical protein